MQRRAPSKTQPKISLRNAHSPSPCSSFVWETGSSPACPEPSLAGRQQSGCREGLRGRDAGACLDPSFAPAG
jgi:hypothetical protein